MINDLLHSGLRYLKAKKAAYADIRWQRARHENISIFNQNVKNISDHSDEGYGIRVLYNGAWGFAGSSILEETAIKKNINHAIELARASARLNKQKISFPHQPPVRAVYESPYKINPFEVSRDTKLHYLFYTNEALLRHPKIKFAQSTLDFYYTEKLFLNTEGSCIQQSFMESGGYFEAVAAGPTGVQKRSYPISHHSQIQQSGYEYVRELDFLNNAPRVAEEAAELLGAPEVPFGEATIILDGYQMALQIHESCGHPAELDRVLGSELSYAGGSFLDIKKRGKFRYGSKLVNIIADATLAGGVGSFAYDDEGIKAQQVELVKNGLFTNYLTSRETAAKLKQKSNAAMRAESWKNIPLIRMTNINLEPGNIGLKDMIADTKNGLFLSTNKSWSIDDLRLNFQFGTELARQIKNGRLGRVYKNPLYYSTTPYFWSQCSAVADKNSCYIWGIPNCGKGEPTQSMHVGHATVPARFEKITVGRGKP